MSASFSYDRRRRLEAACEEADKIIEADARFFSRFPARSHRVRLASQAELEANGEVIGKPITTEPGHRWFTAVKQVAPGVRTRLFVQNSIGSDPDMDEVSARTVYDFLNRAGGSKAAQIEAQLRKALAKRDGGRS